MRNVESLDDVLDQIDNGKEFAGFKPKGKKSLTGISDEDEKIHKKKPSSNVAGTDEDKRKSALPTVNRALIASAESKLNKYIKSSPQFKVIQKQLELLSTELLTYKKEGNLNLMKKTQDLILELTAKKKQFVSIVKNKSTSEKETERKRVKNSPEIKELKSQLEKLENYYKTNNPNSIMKTFSELRKVVESKASRNKEVIEFDDFEFDDTVLELDDIIADNSFTPVTKDYKQMCIMIADIIDTTPEDVAKMKLGTIKKELDENAEDMTPIKDQIEYLKADISIKSKKLRGSDEIVDIMFEIFDFEYQEEQPKDMLAAANVKYVSAIAHNKCSSLNMLHFFDDAVSYGLLGLTLAINKWYKMQKITGSPLSFEGYAYSTIVGTIQRGLYELSSAGRLNPSAIGTLQSKRKRHMELFVKNNPEFMGLPQEMLEDLLVDELDPMPTKVVTEGELTQTIGGDDATADIWANIASQDNPGADDILQAKEQYSRFVYGIKELFSLFETKIDKTTNEQYTTTKKLFDKYDFKLFKLMFGLEPVLSKDGKQLPLNQAEMGIKLSEYGASLGELVSFTQPGVNSRISRMMSKIKIIMDNNINIRSAFEYIYQYWSESMTLISNQREGFELNLEPEFNQKNYNFKI